MHLGLLTCAEPRARTTRRSQLERAPNGIISAAAKRTVYESRLRTNTAASRWTTSPRLNGNTAVSSR